MTTPTPDAEAATQAARDRIARERCCGWRSDCVLSRANPCDCFEAARRVAGEGEANA